MNIIIYARKSLVDRLKNQVFGEDFNLMEITKLDSITELAQRGDSIFLVDVVASGAKTACTLINQAGECPVVLVLGDNPHDWTKAQSMEAHGFVNTGASNNVIKARLRSVWRRFQLNHMAANQNNVRTER